MRRITEVLRLAAQGLSYRQIAQSASIGATTVQSYVVRAKRAGVTWPLPHDLDAGALEALLFTRTEDASRPGRPEPDWLEVHRERTRGKHVTLQLLWLEYKRDHPDGWGYTQFCNHYHRWLDRQDVVMRFEYPAGDRMFVDFCGDTLPITDGETGAIWQAQVFVSALAASGYMYVEATGSQDLASWLGAHVHTFEFYGATPRAVVPDNVKSGVNRACWYL
jgi:transposase